MMNIRERFLCVLFMALYSTVLIGQETMFLAQNKELEEANSQLPVYHIPDYTFTDLKTGTDLRVNADGLYLYSDSVLVNGIVYMYLTTEDDLASVYGFLYGKVSEGKRQGVWQKVLYEEHKEPAVMSVLFYKDGLLDGKVLHCFGWQYDQIRPSVADEALYSRYMVFKDGLGLFSDYHFSNEKLKTRFFLTNGKLTDSYFEIFDKEGNRVLSESYFNGYRINY